MFGQLRPEPWSFGAAGVVVVPGVGVVPGVVVDPPSAHAAPAPMAAKTAASDTR